MDVIIKADFRKIRKKDFLKVYWPQFRTRSFAMTGNGKLFVNEASEASDAVYNAFHSLAMMEGPFLDVISAGVNLLYPEIATMHQLFSLRETDPRRTVIFMAMLIPTEKKRRSLEQKF